MGGSTRTPITQHLAVGLTLMTPNRAASQGQLCKRYYLRQRWRTLSLTSPHLPTTSFNCLTHILSPTHHHVPYSKGGLSLATCQSQRGNQMVALGTWATSNISQ